ncbi:LCP family protein [Paramicrobacterium agarici]|uniref:LCP family protein n=1 Tax=Paramicrobacterium agarici TaxID=630514 RepID=UPI00115079AB|nr:LCP family protein [Microbacterium agarici]TQO21797.1 LytR family transcriptional attenuator [Microbacterium agarici]
MSSLVANPIRYPDTASSPLMTRRAWWLLILGFVIPGSAQVLAGNRKLGRIGLGATLGMWTAAIIAALLFAFMRTPFITLATQGWFLLLVQVVLVAYALLWFVLTLNTFRLLRIIKAAPGARFWIAVATVIFLVLSVGSASGAAYYAGIARGALGAIFGNSAPVAPVDGRYNILLLGGDAGEDREGLRPDSISVVSVDASTGAATIIGLPRDMMRVPFSEGPFHDAYPNGYENCDVSACKLNSVYTEAQLRHADWYPDAEAQGSSPGIEATRDAAEGVTGLSIQFYALIDMAGFSQLIDALGGVEIDVKERLPIGGDENLNNVDGWIEVGKQKLDGYHAEWYARSRHSTSDWDRMRRQRELQEAILRQFTPGNVLSKFQAIADAGSQVVKTDIPQSMLGYFSDLALKTRDHDITNLELSPPTVPDQDNPNFEHIHDLVAEAVAPPETASGDGK